MCCTFSIVHQSYTASTAIKATMVFSILPKDTLAVERRSIKPKTLRLLDNPQSNSWAKAASTGEDSRCCAWKVKKNAKTLASNSHSSYSGFISGKWVEVETRRPSLYSQLTVLNFTANKTHGDLGPNGTHAIDGCCSVALTCCEISRPPPPPSIWNTVSCNTTWEHSSCACADRVSSSGAGGD